MPTPSADTIPSRATRRVRALILWCGVAAAFALVWHFDRALYLALRAPDPVRHEILGRAWYQFLRTIGYLPLWLSIAAAVWAHHRPLLPGAAPYIRWNGLRVALAASIAPGFAEALQNLFRRLRPDVTDGFHRYLGQVPGADPSFGFPSSHAACAFGGAFMVLMLYPRAGIVAILLALGCAWSRILQGGHFPSDVFASALIGYACARLLRPRASRSP